MNGAILYSGPSRIDGSPIVAIATGLVRPSSNPKTGPMIQVWILCADLDPRVAARSGEDAAICGTCPFRFNGKARSCYVDVGRAPLSVWRAYLLGRYPVVEPTDIAEKMRDRKLRIGAYGDPCAVPAWVWYAATRHAEMWTGYSHQWRLARNADYARWFMASCETEADVDAAEAMGWRSFLVVKKGAGVKGSYIRCPASAERGHVLTCADCGACNGKAGAKRRSVIINQH